VASESWVLGQHAAFDPAGPQMQALEHDVVGLYEAEYAQVWDAMLADLNIAPLRSLPQAAQDLYILASQQSPMRALLTSAAQELTLSAVPAPEGARTRGPLAAAAEPATTTDIARLQAVLGGAGQGEGPPPGHEIDERYKPLRDLVAGGPGAPIDQVLKPLSDLQQEMAKLAAAPVNGVLPRLPPGSDPALALRAEAQRQPQPLGRWLTAIAASGAVLRAGGAQQQVVAAFNSGGPASLCPAAVNGRFPFKPGATDETPIDDFGKLFAPGGLIDGFVNTQLRPYIDRAGHTWKPQAADGMAAPVSVADLAQFQQAALIRDLFFSAGGTTPSVRFDITPVSLDAGATQVTLDLDGTPVVYAHGQPRATQITWPGPNRMQNVHLVFDPPPPNGTGVLQDTGPWALFRMLRRGRLQQAGSPDRYTLTFQLGTRQASFDIHSATTRNPFAPDILQDFHCPAVQ
jgi:type VI secretion system protein ImpL